MGSAQRRKGHDYERATAAWYRELGDRTARRNLDEVRDGSGGDVVMDLFPVLVECKVGKRPRLIPALEQVELAAARRNEGELPIVHFHIDGANQSAPGLDGVLMDRETWSEIVAVMVANSLWNTGG